MAGTQTLPRQIAVSGDIAAWQEAPVGAETGGLTVVELYADEGQYVRQGQLLLKMDDTLLKAQLRQASAGVASAKATLAQANADLARAQELRDRGYLAPAGLDQKKAAQGNAQAAVAQAEEKILAVRKWLPRLEKASELYRSGIGRLVGDLSGEIPRAVNLLDRLAARLEEYVQIEGPAAGAAESTPATAGESMSRGGESESPAAETPPAAAQPVPPTEQDHVPDRQ